LDIPTPDEDVKAVNNPTIEDSIRGAGDYTLSPPLGAVKSMIAVKNRVRVRCTAGVVSRLVYRLKAQRGGTETSARIRAGKLPMGYVLLHLYRFGIRATLSLPILFQFITQATSRRGLAGLLLPVT
jgi:hypothetical protein